MFGYNRPSFFKDCSFMLIQNAHWKIKSGICLSDSLSLVMDSFLIFVSIGQVIMATNRADTLDPALLRPGRLDRKIEFPLPDRRQKRLIFSTITGRMNLSEDVDLEDYVARPDRISGADINAICQEAGMHAVRENRYIVLAKDFEKAYKNNVKKDESDHEFYK